jgi:hypothetical protein
MSKQSRSANPTDVDPIGNLSQKGRKGALYPRCQLRVQNISFCLTDATVYMNDNKYLIDFQQMLSIDGSQMKKIAISNHIASSPQALRKLVK